MENTTAKGTKEAKQDRGCEILLNDLILLVLGEQRRRNRHEFTDNSLAANLSYLGKPLYTRNGALVADTHFSTMPASR